MVHPRLEEGAEQEREHSLPDLVPTGRRCTENQGLAEALATTHAEAQPIGQGSLGDRAVRVERVDPGSVGSLVHVGAEAVDQHGLPRLHRGAVGHCGVLRAPAGQDVPAGVHAQRARPFVAVVISSPRR
jgi:hypothetical protein